MYFNILIYYLIINYFDFYKTLKIVKKLNNKKLNN